MNTKWHLICLVLLFSFSLVGCQPKDGSQGEQSEKKNSKTGEVGDGRNQGQVSGGRSLNILFWNVESEGADPKIIAEQISTFDGYSIFAFCEVAPQDFDQFQKACGENFEAIRSKTGNMDRLQIVYDQNRFELVRRLELDEINFEKRYRSPLAAHLKEKESGVEFIVMTNHLARGKAPIRQDQAKKLVDWAREQTLPVIAIGDFNFDFVFKTDTGNEAFKIFLRDNVWTWVRPEKLIDSNWYDPEGDGIDNYIDSILDFAFVAGPAKKWKAESKVIVRDGDFPDDQTTSDHRPIDLRIELPKAR